MKSRYNNPAAWMGGCVAGPLIAQSSDFGLWGKVLLAMALSTLFTTILMYVLPHRQVGPLEGHVPEHTGEEQRKP